VQSETSTGVCRRRAGARRGSEGSGKRSSSSMRSRGLGAVPCETDAWGLDVVVSGSQKGRLMTPPGLGLCAVSEAAQRRAKPAAQPRFYFDWEKTRKGAGEARRAVSRRRSRSWPRSTFALGLLLEEGLEAAFERHVRLGPRSACRREGDGARSSSPPTRTGAPVVTAVSRRPREIEGGDIVKAAARALRHDDRRRAGRAPGQDLPPRPHRLVRRLRHHDDARGGRTRAVRARGRH